MPLISFDPTNIVNILLATAMIRSRGFWWNVIPWVLVFALLVAVSVFRIAKAIHSSRAFSEPLASAADQNEELVDTVGVVIVILVITWAILDHFWHPFAGPRQHNPDDIELQALGGGDDAPQPPVDVEVQDEGGRFGGEVDIGAGREAWNLGGTDAFVARMPGDFPVW